MPHAAWQSAMLAGAGRRVKFGPLEMSNGGRVVADAPVVFVLAYEPGAPAQTATRVDTAATAIGTVRRRGFRGMMVLRGDAGILVRRNWSRRCGGEKGMAGLRDTRVARRRNA